MAIAFDNATSGGETTGTSLTFAHTTGSIPNGVIVVNCESGVSDLIAGVTYNGNALTLVSQVLAANTSSPQSIYLGLAPLDGPHDVVVSRTGSGEIRANAATYAGVNQSLSVDSSGNAVSSGTTSDLTGTATSIQDNCWMIMTGGFQRDPAAGTGSTQRAEAGSSLGLYDNNAAIHPAGMNSMQITYASVGDKGMAVAWITLSPPIPTSVKTWDGLARASIGTINGLALANVKTVDGLA